MSAPIAPSTNAPRLDIRMWLLLALCVLSAILGRLCYLIRPFDSDGSMFIYMGRLISEGGRFATSWSTTNFRVSGSSPACPGNSSARTG
ncbi:MAG: hypothetical protein H7Z14_11760 [Anaerolineae bacterium]|nr:hypothetical protein [Phycisphaerae bacterium]